MEGYSVMLILSCILLSVYGVFSAPWTQPKGPICTSHSGLCDVTFEISENDPLAGQMKYKSSSQICDCPGQTKCPVNTTDLSRVFFQEMSSPGQTITTRLSYCDRKSFPVRDCNQNEVAMTLRGLGPVIADIVGDVICRCSGPLVLHRAMPDGIYSIREYTCGKPTCNVNSSKPPVCERVSHILSMFGFSTESELPCQCPDGFICNTDNPTMLSSMFETPTEFHCELAQ
ncbi:uncharacterized protein LOC123553049 isoform X2 [Mercenaria mercenaria]|uniref:uncharacterized protein LOC123553049 isoform X2 n=1 Tax=Mercenaria mercenaria TaxID=6596 RepID=UPI00234F280A|nr:uncharacterized protein LOC123553049 isoform X2 [Mercenaria mercenaria]